RLGPLDEAERAVATVMERPPQATGRRVVEVWIEIGAPVALGVQRRRSPRPRRGGGGERERCANGSQRPARGRAPRRAALPRCRRARRIGGDKTRPHRTRRACSRRRKSGRTWGGLAHPAGGARSFVSRA